MKEKYSVELEILTKSFKDKLTESEKDTKKLADKIKDASQTKLDLNSGAFKSSIAQLTDVQLSKLQNVQDKIKKTISNLELGKIDTKQAQKSLNVLLQDAEWIDYEFGRMTNTKILLNIDTQGIESMNKIGVDADLIKNNIKLSEAATSDLNASIKNLEKDSKKVSNNFNEISSSVRKSNVNNVFKESVGNTRRFIMSLFSLHTAWSMVSRVSSEVLSNDDYLNAKSELIASTMSNMLAPALKLVIDTGQYAVITIAKLIEIFTGYNALANVTTKNLKKTEQASKSMNKALGGIDEITNLKSSSGSLSNGIQADLNALNDFQEKVKKVNELFDRFSKTSFGQWIMSAIDWFKSLDPAMQAVLVTGGLLAAKFGIPTLFSGLISSTKNANTEVGTLSNALRTLSALAVAGITVYVSYQAVKEMIATMKEAEEQIKRTVESTQLLTGKYQNLDEQMQQWNETGELTNEKIEALVFGYSNTEVKLKDQIALLMESHTLWGAISGAYGMAIEQTTSLTEKTKSNNTAFYNLYLTGKLNNEQKEKLIQNLKDEVEGLETANSHLHENSNEYKVNKNRISEVKQQLENLRNGNYDTTAEINLKANTSSAKNELKNFFGKIASGPSALMGAVGLNNIDNWVNSFDVGTNYVPNDQLALIHEGEAIVPKKYNPVINQNYTNNFNSNEMAYLLREIKDTLEEKEFNAYITEEDIGRASSRWSESNRRIMGR